MASVLQLVVNTWQTLPTSGWSAPCSSLRTKSPFSRCSRASKGLPCCCIVAYIWSCCRSRRLRSSTSSGASPIWCVIPPSLFGPTAGFHFVFFGRKLRSKWREAGLRQDEDNSSSMASAHPHPGKGRKCPLRACTCALWVLCVMGSRACPMAGIASACGLFPLLQRELPCLRLRGGNAPRTPVTPARASRRLAHQSPELKNASPSLLSGRQKKTLARTRADG